MDEAEILKMACKYAFVPNELGYCGAKNFSALFENFINNEDNASIAEVKDALTSFRAMYAYLQLIARYNSLEPFDKSVLEAYWLGNKLLENVPKEAVQSLIMKEFAVIPEEVRRRKAEYIKKPAYVQHSFHVLYVNFLNPRLKPVLENLDRCVIKWGKVLDINNGKLKVKSICLMNENGELKLKEKTFNIENRFVESPRKDMLVSIHWNNAIESISKEQQKNLKKYLLENISLAISYNRSEHL